MPKVTAEYGEVTIEQAGDKIRLLPDMIPRLCAELVAAGAYAGLGQDYPPKPIQFMKGN